MNPKKQDNKPERSKGVAPTGQGQALLGDLKVVRPVLLHNLIMADEIKYKKAE